jgi:2-polyprenyl-3-methyl-5-hydroxy-6-metoxy-1,4-benzoquinol methylase
VSATDRERWNTRWQERSAESEPRPPSAWILSLDWILPRHGRALDLAGGAGRHALWMARRGLDVTIADVSEVGLDLARRAARAEGLVVFPVQIDLEEAPVPRGPWDAVVVHHFLQRSVFAGIANELSPAGVLAFCHPTLVNLERHAQPGPRFLLDPGEAAVLIERAGLEIVSAVETWSETDRHEARVIARRPARS